MVVQQERSGDIINVAQYFPLPIFTPHKYLLKTALFPPPPQQKLKQTQILWHNKHFISPADFADILANQVNHCNIYDRYSL